MVMVLGWGTAGDLGTIRIGREDAQTTAFMAGVYPTHLTGCFVQVTSAGQLGCDPTAPEGKEGKEGKPGTEGKEGKEGKPGTEGKEGKQGERGEQGKEGPAGKEGKEGKVSAKGLKICVQDKAGGSIKLPPCKKGYNEKEVAEL
jgi:hypothetical protein